MSSANPNFEKVATRVKKMRSSAVRDLFAAANNPAVISLSGGMPDVSLLPVESINIAVAAATGEKRSEALQYGSTDGRLGTKEAICKVVATVGVVAEPKDVLLTTGAQEALDLFAKAYIDPGDIILAEGPTYLGALQAFSAYEPDIRCIDFDDNGMRMDLLEAELERIGKGNPRLKFCYVIPSFQNPGGVSMSADRRLRLIELAKEYGFLILEDDPYGALRYEGEGIPPLKTKWDDVVYLGTISKVFAPGLRTGWIIAKPEVLSKINLVKQGADLCGSTFDQVVVEQYFNATPWKETLQDFISVYRERRDAMLNALEKYFPEGSRWTHPEGGLFVWATLPEYINTAEMLDEALEAGVTYVPGNSFYPDGVTGSNSMRINFSFATPERIEEAIRRLAGVAEKHLR